MSLFAHGGSSKRIQGRRLMLHECRGARTSIAARRHRIRPSFLHHLGFCSKSETCRASVCRAGSVSARPVNLLLKVVTAMGSSKFGVCRGCSVACAAPSPTPLLEHVCERKGRLTHNDRFGEAEKLRCKIDAIFEGTNFVWTRVEVTQFLLGNPSLPQSLSKGTLYGLHLATVDGQGDYLLFAERFEEWI